MTSSAKGPLIEYILHLADDSLVQGHRNSEWTGHGPILEQDIAISNIALDLIGQARLLYQYAAELLNAEDGAVTRNFCSSQQVLDTTTEDSLAYLRDIWEFRNCLLVEQPNGDWAKTILKQFFYSAAQFILLNQLIKSADPTLAAISAKAIKEVAYHERWASEWVCRLGDGTEESHRRMEQALEELWSYTGELFIPTPYENEMSELGVGANLELVQSVWQRRVEAVLAEAKLAIPASRWMHSGGKLGTHSEHLGYLLAEMQFLQRAYPNMAW